LRVSGEGFQVGSAVDLSIGEFLTTYTPVGSTRVSADRGFVTNLEIPASAQAGKYWVVMSITENPPIERSSTNLFTVTPPVDPNAQRIHLVRPGDTLNEIAARYQRNVADILSVNPQIINPNRIGFGERLIIPPQDETILITPSSGPPGTSLQVSGLGFPTNSTVTLGIGRHGASFNIIGTIPVDETGTFRTQLVIPVTAGQGERWVVVTVGSIASGSKVEVTSNEFTVTRQFLSMQPRITIWPESGPPGTYIHVVGSNYPPRSQIEYSLGVEGFDLDVSGTTWTEINGTFAVEIMIPAHAQVGESWVLFAATVREPTVEATSPLFIITN
jgi:LysM repeat protein